MKIFGLTLVMALAIGGAAMADTAVIEVFPGWNYISCPLAPMNLEVEPYDGMDYTEPYYAFDEVAASLEAYKLNRFEATSGSEKLYFADLDFGKLLLGDGYQLFVDPSYFSGPSISLQYTGIKNGIRASDSDPLTDMWISLPGLQESPNLNNGGWHLIGTPYATDVPAYEILPDESIKWNVYFTDGNEMVDWMTAVDVKGWVKDTMYGYGPSGEVTFTYTTESYIMKPGLGYWFQTNVDNIAMVIDLP